MRIGRSEHLLRGVVKRTATAARTYLVVTARGFASSVTGLLGPGIILEKGKLLARGGRKAQGRAVKRAAAGLPKGWIAAAMRRSPEIAKSGSSRQGCLGSER